MSFNKTRVLVTGAAGFMGSFLCEELVTHHYHVVGVDNFFRGKHENIAHLIGEHFSIEKVDLSLRENVAQLNELILKNNIDVIYHLAAINGTQYFYEKPMFVLDQNIKITQNLLSAISDTKVKYLIYTSSSEVYGDPLVIPTDEKQPILLHTLADRDSYAASKAMGEFYCRLFGKQHHLAFLNLRVFNMYGERMVDTRYSQVIPEFIHRMLYESKFTILGNGKHTRSFCYIRDAVLAMRELMEKTITGTVNLGNDHEINILELAELMHQLEQQPLHPIFLAERPDDHKRRCPDISQLKSILPQFKLTSLKSGLEKTIKYYKNK